MCVLTVCTLSNKGVLFNKLNKTNILEIKYKDNQRKELPESGIQKRIKKKYKYELGSNGVIRRFKVFGVIGRTVFCTLITYDLKKIFLSVLKSKY